MHAFLLLAHLLGLALALGSATAKLTLLLKSRADPAFLPAYFAAVRPISRLIAVGTGLLVLSGIGWLAQGYPMTPRLTVKLVMVGVIVVIGATLDRVVEPKFQKLAQSGGLASPDFVRMRGRYLLAEASATGLFYVIVVMWILS